MLNTENISNIFQPNFTVETVLIPLTSFVTLYILFQLTLKLIAIRMYLRQKYIFLEIKPTDRTLKTPFSTSQLFTILHSLQKPRTFLDKFLGMRKSISYELVSNKNEIAFRYAQINPDTKVKDAMNKQKEYVIGYSRYFKKHSLKMQNDLTYLDNEDSEHIIYRLSCVVSF